VVQGGTLLIAATFSVINLVVDILYAGSPTEDSIRVSQGHDFVDMVAKPN